MKRFLLALGCLVALPRVLTAQTATFPGIRVGFNEPPLSLQEPAALRAPWLGAPRGPSAGYVAAFERALSAELAKERLSRATSYRLLTLYGTPLTETAADEAEPARREILGVPTKYANLQLDGQARVEIRTDRVREERCSPALSLDPTSACRGQFKAPTLDNQVNIRSTGLLGQRVHVNVDFDTEREFSANNDIQVYYEGLQDEIVRRVDVGTVVFAPPPSRFITAAIPANNFGINATFDIGPVQLQTIAATQKSSVVAERTYTIGQTTSQTQDRQVRDLDFESGRFFWVIDPDSLPAYPAIDILDLDPNQLTPTYRPTDVRLYRYRSARGNSGVNPNLGGITAIARRTDSDQTFGPVQWELLIQGRDYYLDPSGLWIVLASKLDQNDYLAVSYRTAAGTTIGSFPEVDRGTNSGDFLELIVRPLQTPAEPTFRYEMRQIYRAGGADLQASTLVVGISLNQSERPVTGSSETYLQ